MITYTITAISDTKAGISAIIENSDTSEKTTLLFKPSVWKDIGLKTGDSFSEEQLFAVKDAAELSRAIARSEGMLANSDYSRMRLINRLLHYDFERDICERAADYMIEQGFIREEEQTKRITKFFCKTKHWGKKRIAAELMGRGYARSVIMESLSSITDEEYYSSLLELVKSKYPYPPESRDEREKRIAALGRMGFSASEIVRALDETKEIFE